MGCAGCGMKYRSAHLAQQLVGGLVANEQKVIGTRRGVIKQADKAKLAAQAKASEQELEAKKAQEQQALTATGSVETIPDEEKQ